jgi:hypothetical protein
MDERDLGPSPLLHKPMEKFAMMTSTNDEQRARRVARSVGLVAKKSRRGYSIDNHGGFMLIDPFHNWIVAGERFDLSADEVIAECQER